VTYQKTTFLKQLEGGYFNYIFEYMPGEAINCIPKGACLDEPRPAESWASTPNVAMTDAEKAAPNESSVMKCRKSNWMIEEMTVMKMTLMNGTEARATLDSVHRMRSCIVWLSDDIYVLYGIYQTTLFSCHFAFLNVINCQGTKDSFMVSNAVLQL
jgi:hypothetical protein